MLSWLRKTRNRQALADDSGELFDENFQRRLESLVIASRRAYRGRARAERRSKKSGSGIEFADHRVYTPGDDFRYLDWNVYRRTGRLLVRLFEEEEDLSVYILLDTSQSMGSDNARKLNYAKRVAAALAYVALAHLDRVSILTFSDRMQHRLPPTRGKNRVFKVFDFLRPIDSSGPTDLAASLKTFAAQNKRRGVAILISDLYDPAGFDAGINTLRYARFEPCVIQTFDADAARPDLHGDAMLVDTETGEERMVTVTPQLLDRYERAHVAYRHEIGRFCAEKQVSYFDMPIHVPVEDAVLSLLRRGAFLI